MESSESHEPSYYEVALTNRQVLIAFVVLLSSIVAAFLSGVWIGRGGSSGSRPGPVVAQTANGPAEPPLEQLSFFSNKEPGARTATSAPPAATSSPATPPAALASRVEPTAPAGDSDPADDRATEQMRQNLDATMAANRTVPAPSAAPVAGTRTTAKPAAPAAAPAKPAAKETGARESVAAKPAAAGRIYVQVYSSTNAARAKEIVAQLRKAGFAVVVAETPKGNGSNHRVRVGPYAERAKADAAATKLRRDFRLETWVTDSP